VFAGLQEDDRQSTLLHDVLRGVKMATIAESQSMTPRAGPRSGLLPPISRDEPPDANSNNSNNNTYVHVGYNFLGLWHISGERVITSSCIAFIN